MQNGGLQVEKTALIRNSNLQYLKTMWSPYNWFHYREFPELRQRMWEDAHIFNNIFWANRKLKYYLKNKLAMLPAYLTPIPYDKKSKRQ